MRHLKKVKKLGRTRSHQKAMLSNMMVSFFNYERIKTTHPKAKQLRKLSEKIITRAKENTLHNKRLVYNRLRNRAVIAKLFDQIAPRYRDVHGGYTRIIKLSEKRAGDGAEMSILELIEQPEQSKK